MENIYVDGLLLAATSLTTNPPHFQDEKNSPKLKDRQIFMYQYLKFWSIHTLIFIIFKT